MKNIFLLLLLNLILLPINSADLKISKESRSLVSYSQIEFDSSKYFNSNNTFNQGIEVISETDGVSIFFNGLYYSSSYMRFNNLKSGNYYIQVKKEGYKPVSTWVKLEENRRLIFTVTLAREFGYLEIEANTDNFEIYTENGKIKNRQALPTGRYKIILKAFGYEEEERVIYIRDRIVTKEIFNLKKAKFNIESFKADKKRYNSKGKEGFGDNRFFIGVNAPGEGSFEIRNSRDEVIFSKKVAFTTWIETVKFTMILPDGEYIAVITSNDIKKRLLFSVDSKLVQKLIPLYQESSGLSLCPTGEINSKGLTQYQFAAGYKIPDEGLKLIFNIHSPLNSNLQLHGGMNVELDMDDNLTLFDLGAGTLLSNSIKKIIYSLNFNYLFRSSISESYNSYNHKISINTPLTINLNPIYISLTPEVNYLVSDSFNYNLSFGIHFDNQKIRGGISSKYSSQNFKDYNIYYGGELYYLIPKTQSYIGIVFITNNNLDSEFLINFSVLN